MTAAPPRPRHRNTPDINRILAHRTFNASSIRGADMGRRSQKEGKPERLYLQRVRMVDYCYDTGGAYWGMGSTDSGGMWCAFSNPATTDNEFPIMVFVRGRDRDDAMDNVLDELPGEGWSFYR